MCVVCGCGEPGQSAVAPARAHAAALEAPVHSHAGLDYGAGPARVSVPGMSPQRVIKLEADVLGENNCVAQHNRRHFESHGVTALNLLSSPGSGKTSLLCATIAALRKRAPAMEVAVIEGDQQTSFDADRIRATGAQAIQVNTGKGCHLDALMVRDAFARLALHTGSHSHHHSHHHSHERDHAHARSLLFIENVGNLVCPAMWDLGEAAKVVILSVTEGEDKPLKYADMFAAAKVMVLSKIDLLPHLHFDVGRCVAYARRVNPHIEVLQLSASTGQGMKEWLAWVLHGTQQAGIASHDGARACRP
ncbi:MAG: hydrogenase nickel incorporation protein HypB [Burkholderiaceae bacterium]|nr:hydrogenase nickel incorporation protein HypB [Burkholderiaceae bacterium]